MTIKKKLEWNEDTEGIGMERTIKEELEWNNNKEGLGMGAMQVRG